MASSKPSKRLHTDSDSDGETTNSTFPHFIVLESLQEKQLTKLNPFVIEKVISGIVNPVSVKKLQNGTLLVEVGVLSILFAAKEGKKLRRSRKKTPPSRCNHFACSVNSRLTTSDFAASGRLSGQQRSDTPLTSVCFIITCTAL